MILLFAFSIGPFWLLHAYVAPVQLLMLALSTTEPPAQKVVLLLVEMVGTAIALFTVKVLLAVAVHPLLLVTL